jgi:formate-dependent nitrite reductase membrane component NrfD
LDAIPPSARAVASPSPEEYDGRTYYGRPALKAAPFEKWVVGGYIFVAGLSGAAQLLSTIIDLGGRGKDDAVVSRGRWLSLLAPTIGSALLIYDLKTPKRFYNMLRIAKRTSPMSIGTWILMGFSAFSGLTISLDVLSRWFPRFRKIARVTQVPAAAAGAGLSTYTASLLSATSTPLWAAAPKSLAVRFGSSSMASGAAALSLGARRAGHHRRARDLDTLLLASLALELAATSASEKTYREKGVSAGLESGVLPTATTLGMWLPFGMHALSTLAGSRHSRLQQLASAVALVGSLCLRVGVLQTGNASANNPQDYFRFARPRNLPDKT